MRICILQLVAEFVETHRGGKAIYYEGYLYAKIRDGKEGNTDRCITVGVTGRSTSEGFSVIVRNEQSQYSL